MQAEQIIEVTKRWINQVVIGCNFCPFAAREMQRDSIRYCVEESNDVATCLLSLIRECERLNTDAAIETTFLIIPDTTQSFNSYLDLITVSEKLLKKQKYDGIYQLASFHPEYRFSGSKADDAANYTNRSVFPMIQILRETSVTKALAHYSHSPETIPANNIIFARGKGLVYMKKLKETIAKIE